MKGLHSIFVSMLFTLFLIVVFIIYVYYLFKGWAKLNSAGEKYGILFKDYFTGKKIIPEGYKKETEDALKIIGKAFLILLVGALAISGINYLLTHYF